MADRDIEIGSSPTFKQRMVELATNVFAKCVSLGTFLTGEDAAVGRIRVENKPDAADAIQETLQNAVSTAVNGTAIDMAGYKSLVVVCTITATITVNFEASYDGGTTYVGIALCATTGTAAATLVATATATGSFVLPSHNYAMTHFRARTSSPSGSPAATVKTVKCAR